MKKGQQGFGFTGSIAASAMGQYDPRVAQFEELSKTPFGEIRLNLITRILELNDSEASTYGKPASDKLKAWVKANTYAKLGDIVDRLLGVLAEARRDDGTFASSRVFTGKIVDLLCKYGTELAKYCDSKEMNFTTATPAAATAAPSEDIGKLLAQIEKYQSESRETATKFGEEKTKLVEDKIRLEAEAKSLNAKIAEDKARVEAETATLRAELEKLRQENQRNVEKSQAEARESTTKLAEEKARFVEEKARLEADTVALRGQLERQKQESERPAAEVTRLIARVQSLEEELSSANEARQTLLEELSDAEKLSQAQKNELERKFLLLEMSHTRLTEEKCTFTALNTTLTQEKAALQLELQQAKESRSELSAQVQLKTAEVGHRESKIIDLEKQIAEHSARIKALEAEVKEKEAYIRETVEKQFDKLNGTLDDIMARGNGNRTRDEDEMEDEAEAPVSSAKGQSLDDSSAKLKPSTSNNKGLPNISALFKTPAPRDTQPLASATKRPAASLNASAVGSKLNASVIVASKAAERDAKVKARLAKIEADNSISPMRKQAIVWIAKFLHTLGAETPQNTQVRNFCTVAIETLATPSELLATAKECLDDIRTQAESIRELNVRKTEFVTLMKDLTELGQQPVDKENQEDLENIGLLVALTNLFTASAIDINSLYAKFKERAEVLKANTSKVDGNTSIASTTLNY